jgi:oxygen-independent coproporphyrinogen-3 oxidase
MIDNFHTLLRKYNQPGPRYTSYPTVPYWENSPTVEQWISHLSAELDNSEAAKRGSAVYLHIPFCQQLCTYCGCNTRITKKYNRVNSYIDAIHREWSLYQERLGRSMITVAELHLGGGTPTYLTPEDMQRLLIPLLSDMKLTQTAELSFEADPRVTTVKHLQTLYDLGFRRLSLGIQDFDPKVQEIVNRVQSVAMVRALTEQAREIGYTSINYDLIYGLPLQTKNSVEETFTHITTLKPDRIAFYGYAHIPWIKLGQRKYGEADLPDGEAKHALYQLGRDALAAQGYHDIGLDHFALPHDKLWQAVENKTLFRNFMGYMPQHVSPMIGLGVSSIGDSWTSFMQNEKHLETYEQRVIAGEIPLMRGHILTREDLVMRRHVLNIMTQGETSWDQADNFTDFLCAMPDKLRPFIADNLIDYDTYMLKIKPHARAFMRNICMAFDARLARKTPTKPTFSKTI